MVLILIAVALILAIAAFQAWQGVFSSLVMTILTALSAGIALATYESLAAELYNTQPAYAHAIALVATFVLPLLALRIAFDWLIRGNVILGNDITSVWIGRGVAGLFGLVTGMILVGVLALAVQMLPVGASILGYQPFDGQLERDDAFAPFYPDDFVLAMAGHFSRASLADERRWGDSHDDLLRELYCARNTADLHGRVDAPAGCLHLEEVVNVGLLTPYFRDHAPERLTDPMGSRHVLISLRVDKSAWDEDGAWRLPGTQFRLVGQSGKSYYPLGGEPMGVTDAEGRDIRTRWPRANQQGQADALVSHVKPAYIRTKQGEREWDMAALVIVARMRTPDDWKRSGVPGATVPQPGALRVVWLYAMEPDDEPDYMVFRRTVTEAFAPPSP